MSKYTAGPWEWFGKNCLAGFELHGSDDILSSGDDGKAHGLHTPLINHHWNEETANANMRLIAAAPDPLEALQTLVDNFGGTPSEKVTGLMAARAAIKKAIG